MLPLLRTGKDRNLTSCQYLLYRTEEGRRTFSVVCILLLLSLEVCIVFLLSLFSSKQSETEVPSKDVPSCGRPRITALPEVSIFFPCPSFQEERENLIHRLQTSSSSSLLARAEGGRKYFSSLLTHSICLRKEEHCQ